VPRAKQLPPPPLPPPGGEQRLGAILHRKSGKVAADADLVTTAVPTTAPATKPIDLSALRRARLNLTVLNFRLRINCTSQSLCGSSASGQRANSQATKPIGIIPKEVAKGHIRVLHDLSRCMTVWPPSALLISSCRIGVGDFVFAIAAI